MGKKVVILADEGYEDLELHYPRLRLLEAGYHVSVAGLQKNYTGKKGYPCKNVEPLEQVRSEEIDAVVVPGGYAPDRLRMILPVLDLVRAMHAQKKVIAFICHGGWVPISAGVLKGVRATSYKAIYDDMVNAGALWEDLPVVVDRHFISSRTPDDLPDFCKAIIAALE